MGKNNSEKQYQNSHKIFVCLDTNILISLAGLQFGNEYEIGQMKKFGQFQDMCEFKKLIDKKEIIAIVTPFVLEEILQGVEKYGNDTLRYLQKSNVKILDISENELKTYFEQVEKISTVYSERISRETIKKICIANNITNYQFPKRVFKLGKTSNGEPAVQNDARIMAEASLLGVALVTNNTLDFINNHRQEILRHFNQKLHLSSNAIPLSTRAFLWNYKKKQMFSFPKSDNVKFLTSPKDAKSKKRPPADEPTL